MDLSASIFAFTLLLLGLVITYHWGIKPEREEKKRMAERAHSEIRRRQSEDFRRHAVPPQPAEPRS